MFSACFGAAFLVSPDWASRACVRAWGRRWKGEKGTPRARLAGDPGIACRALLLADRRDVRRSPCASLPPNLTPDPKICHPLRYGSLFLKYLREHRPAVWLLNTGWMGGGPGIGYRTPLSQTARAVDAIERGELAGGRFRQVEAPFDLLIPAVVPGVPDESLSARDTWPDKEAFELTVQGLASQFREARRGLGPGPTLWREDGRGDGDRGGWEGDRMRGVVPCSCE